MADKNYILFSPLGDTDPIRGCRDGACLHIIRYYHPTEVHLFYTKDMADKQHKDQRYTRAILHVNRDITIHEEFTDITDPQNYDCFNQLFPEYIRLLHEKNKQATILLNLSSGTPQMKTALAILATENSWCKGVQVVSPERGSNRSNIATQDNEDIDALIENNFDDDDVEAVNRCNEPPLHVFRYFREKNQIVSLIEKYEYRGAYEIAKDSPNIPKAVKKLLRHADLRSSLLFDEAAKVMDKWKGKALFVTDTTEKALLEYYYLMKVDQQKGKLPEMMVKIAPFLFEYLQMYVKSESRVPFFETYCTYENGKYRVIPEKMEKSLQQFYNEAFGSRFKNSDVSFQILFLYCRYMKRQQLAKNGATHTRLMKLNVMNQAVMNHIRNLRNEAAHTIVNINEGIFEERVGLHSWIVLQEFGEMLSILYQSDVGNQPSIYEKINAWIKEIV